MKTLITTLILLTISTNCNAKFNCKGSVGKLIITGTGSVILSYGTTSIHGICNLVSQGPNTISNSSCEHIYDTILSAKRTGEPITVYYDFFNKTSLTCSSLPFGQMVPSAYAVGVE